MNALKKMSLLASFIPFFVSCHTEYRVVSRFFLKNESDHDIKIEVISFLCYSTPRHDTTVYNINAGQQICSSSDFKRYAIRRPNPFGDEVISVTIYFGDMISIMYNQNDNSPYNPIKIENYSEEITKTGNDRTGRITTYKYTYTFTNQDFEAAVLATEKDD
jgi:hypothetical protein